MNASSILESVISESPMSGEPGQRWDESPEAASARRAGTGQVKSAGRDEVSTILAEILGVSADSFKRAGQFSLKITHAGTTYHVRQTSSSIRLLEPSNISFDVSGCSRARAAKVIGTFILAQRPAN